MIYIASPGQSIVLLVLGEYKEWRFYRFLPLHKSSMNRDGVVWDVYRRDNNFFFKKKKNMEKEDNHPKHKIFEKKMSYVGEWKIQNPFFFFFGW